jgi:hypothetical protein
MSDMTFILHVGRNAPASTSPASIALPFASQKLSSSLPDPAIKLPSIFDVLGVPLLRSKGEQGFGLNSIQRAEIETQTQQIDAAIKLLQVQYNAIMSSVRKNQEAQERKFAYQFVLPVRDCSSNIPSQRCPTQMTPQAGAAHRKRAAEESLDDRASKKSVANSCGKLALNAEVSDPRLFKPSARASIMLIFCHAFADCLRDLPAPAKGVGPTKGQISIPKREHRLQAWRDIENDSRHLVRARIVVVPPPNLSC